MPHCLPLVLLLTALLSGIIAPLAQAQQETSADSVIATVNGSDITLGHMIALRAGLPPQYDEIPPQNLFDGILNQLVQQELLSQSLEGEPSRRIRLMIENESRAIIASEVISKVMDAAVSEEAIQAAYNAQYLDSETGTEYHAAHILVTSEDEAKELIAKLDDGADFSALAREFSDDTSGPGGGDLGWFGEGVMVTPFFEAVAALDVGEVSAPVQTDFGWHVILLKDTRATERPDLESVRADLEDVLRNAALDDYINRLEKQGKVVRPDIPGLEAAIINDTSLLEQ